MAAIDRRGNAIDESNPAVDTNPNPGLAIKSPCRAATTAAITLSGEQTIDGVACVEDDRVLVKNQTDQTTNGIYAVSTGNWQRTTDAQSNSQWAAGTAVLVTSGTINAGLFFRQTTADPIDVGTSNLAFTGFSGIATTIAATSLLGNPTGSPAAAVAVTLGATLSFSGTTLRTGSGSGDVSWSANGFVTVIGANKVTGAKFRQSVALSVVGNATNGTADVTDIAAGSDFQVLRRSGTAIGFGSVNLASANAVTGQLPLANIASINNNTLLGNSSGSSAAPTAQTIGATLAFSGGALQTGAGSGDISWSANSYVTTIGAHKVTNAMRAQMPAQTLKGNNTGSTADENDLVVSTVQALLGYPVILAAFANNVNFNSVADTTLTITCPTTNWRFFAFTVINTGTTASLTAAQFGIFSQAAGAGVALQASGTALSGITSNAANTASSAASFGGSLNTFYNFTTVFFRITQAQGAAASGSVYLFVAPLP